MGILSRTFAVVLLFMGLSSAQLLSLLLFLIPEKTVDEKFLEVKPPADTLTDAQVMEMPPVNLAYDSTAIYKKLIVEENEKAEVSAFGAIALGTMDAFWVFVTVLGTAMIAEDDSKSTSETVVGAIGGRAFLLMGVVGLVITTPFFVYEVYKVSSRGWHARQRDEYYRSYDAYVKRRSRAQSGQSLAQVFVAPSLDFANGSAGLNMLVMF